MRPRHAGGRAMVAVIAVLAAAALWPAAEASAGPAPAASDPAAVAMLRLTLKASRTVGYAGTIAVTVTGLDGTRSRTLHVVHGDGDHLVIAMPDPPGPATGSMLVQEGMSRSVLEIPDGAIERGEGRPAAAIDPDTELQPMLAKYRVVLEGRGQMLQRDAAVLRLVRESDGRLVERWTVDAGTGLLLRRESFDAAESVERLVAFTQVTEPYTPTEGELHPAATTAGGTIGTQQWFGAEELSAELKVLRLPKSLPDGYRARSGTAFPADGATVFQVVYSDGLEDVSLFAQPGRLAATSLPPTARPVSLQRVKGWIWDAFPRGIAWQSGPGTLTLVGASPTDELVHMARGLPQAPVRRSPGQRLRHLLSWIRSRLP